jgi:catechol 2,3-dioxygenase-like lactoylglutathione lyase family enzyme
VATVTRRHVRHYDPGMSITGVHALLYTSEPEALREVLRDVFGWDYVEAHPGWLIFKLPPAELGVHPIEESGAPRHELSFMCDDLDATMTELRARGVEFRGEPQNAGFGITITVLLPGGVEAQLYEPRHVTAI